MRQYPWLKLTLYALGTVALAIGLWGFGIRLFVGDRDVNYGSYVPWGLWVAMYLFFAGIATGAFMVATLDYLFRIPLFRGVGRLALWGAAVTMPAALATIAMDLGQMWRIWHVYAFPSFTSVLAQLVWGYTLFMVLILGALLVALRWPTSPLLRPLMGLGLVLAVFLSGGVGALLGVNASRATWHVGMLPAQFPVFSLTSGVALLLVALGWFGDTRDARRPRQLRVLGVSLVVLLLVKAYYLWTDLSLALYTNLPGSADAVHLVMFGRYGWAFWSLQVGLGMLLPAVVLLLPRARAAGHIVGLMGVLALLGLAVARANIIFPAMAIPELQGLMTAFSGPHLSFDYVPSLMEWSVTLGVVGAATVAFLLGTDRLPLLGSERPTEVIS
jgi:protein NrfD